MTGLLKEGSPLSGTLAASLPYLFCVEIGYNVQIAHCTLYIVHFNKVLGANIGYLPKLHPSAILKANNLK